MARWRWQQGCDIGDGTGLGTGILQGLKRIRTFPFLFSFLSHPASSGMQHFFLCSSLFPCSLQSFVFFIMAIYLLLLPSLSKIILLQRMLVSQAKVINCPFGHDLTWNTMQARTILGIACWDPSLLDVVLLRQSPSSTTACLALFPCSLSRPSGSPCGPQF